MVLLARYTDANTRTPVLTLSLLPNQLSWFAGPILASVLASRALPLPFIFGAAACAVGALLSLTLSRTRTTGYRPDGS